MDIKEITKGLNKYNTALVESAEKLGESSQKMIAQQLGEQKKDFSSFLAGRKLQKAIRNTDRTALEQAKKHLDDLKSGHTAELQQAEQRLNDLKGNDSDEVKRAQQNLDKANRAQELALKNDKEYQDAKFNMEDLKNQLEQENLKGNSANYALTQKLNKEYNEAIDKESEERQRVEKQNSNVISLASEELDAAKKEDAKRIEKSSLELNELQTKQNESIKLATENFEKESETYNKSIEDAGKSDGFDKFAGGLKTLTGGLIDIAPIFDDVIKYVNAFKDVSTGFLEFTANLSESLQGVKLIFRKKFAKRLQNIVKGFFVGFGKILHTVFVKPFLLLGKVVKSLAGMLKTVFVTIGNLVKQFILIPIRTAVVALGSAIAGAFTAAVATIGAIPLAIAAGVIGLVLLAFIFKDYITEKWGEFKLKFTEFMEALKLKASEIKTFVSDKWTEYVITPIENFMMKIKNLLSLVSEKIDGFKTSIGIVDEDTRTQLDSARDSGLYDEDFVGKSELDKSKLGDATTQQLEAIIRDDDLREDDMKLVQDELAMRKQQALIDSTGITPIPNTTGDELAEGTIDVAAAAQQIVASVNTVQQSQSNVSNNTTIAGSNPTTGNSDPSAGTGNGMGWGSFAGQGGYSN